MAMTNKNTFESEEEKAKKKAEIRKKKRKPKMKVSGKSVFELQRMMRGKAKSKDTP